MLSRGSTGIVGCRVRGHSDVIVTSHIRVSRIYIIPRYALKPYEGMVIMAPSTPGPRAQLILARHFEVYPGWQKYSITLIVGTTFRIPRNFWQCQTDQWGFPVAKFPPTVPGSYPLVPWGSLFKKGPGTQGYRSRG